MEFDNVVSIVFLFGGVKVNSFLNNFNYLLKVGQNRY